MSALSLDLRKRIVAAFDRGGFKQNEVAELFSVSAGTVSKLLRQRRDTGDLAPLYANCKGKPKILAADEQRLRELVKVALTAVARKLLIHLNTELKSCHQIT